MLFVLPLFIAIVLPIPLMFVVSGAGPEVAAPPADDGGSPPVQEDPEMKRRNQYAGKDPARVVVNRIHDGDYSSPEEVAAGRFLAGFDEQAGYLDHVDMDQLRVVHRTRNWVLVAVPYDWIGKESGRVEIRFANQGKTWKIDRLRVDSTR
ncbi:MAG: hypothetical protein O7J95_04095 [Planctomycetota bacterium]|nr:hypothetical protein [Planctomycetota bacterium]